MKDYVAMYEKKKEECLEKSKTLWARVGMSFDLTDKEYQQFMELKDSPEIDDYVISLIQKGKARLDGNTYFPEYCNDNLEDEIEMELSGELFVDSKVMKQDVSDKKLLEEYQYPETQNNIKNLVSDATERKKEKELLVCPLTEKHLEQVVELDDLSGNYVEQWIEDNEDYAWGLFQGDELVGYCTIGGADDCPEAIEKYDGYQQEDFLLSDVYIKPKYRRQGYGHQMVQKVLEHVLKEEQQNVFITLLYDGLAKFYEPLGFQWVDNSKEYCMVRDKRRSELKKEGTKMGLKEFLGYFDFDYDIVSPGSAYEQKIRQERLEDGNLSTEDMDKHLICLIDKQGANLGDVDKERYPIAAESVEKIIERMNVYIQDSVITEFEDALKERNVDVSDLYLEDMIMQCKILGIDDVCYRLAEAVVNPELIYITELSADEHINKE